MGKGEMGKGKGWERTSVEEEAKKEEEAEEGVGTARREVRWVIWRKEATATSLLLWAGPGTRRKLSRR